jgi:hypothetical protein
VKKRGFAVALLLAISGILRLAGPGGASAPRAEVSGKKKQPAPAESVTSSSTYPDALQRTINEFGSSPNACFVIAILADPVHTHLALSFDRGIAALQQAAQRMGYSFDRAILPWNINPANPSDDIEKRQAALQEQRERESYPGLLIFRKGADRRQHDQTSLACGDSVNADAQPLFVFVVGESPTGGLRKQQFRTAFVKMTEIAGKAIEDRPLRILGPTFSGSLDSLNTELKRISDQRPDWKIYVYSGSVTDAVSIKRFSRGPGTLHFSSFQENDEYTRDRFIQFICSKDYPPFPNRAQPTLPSKPRPIISMRRMRSSWRLAERTTRRKDINIRTSSSYISRERFPISALRIRRKLQRSKGQKLSPLGPQLSTWICERKDATTMPCRYTPRPRLRCHKRLSCVAFSRSCKSTMSNLRSCMRRIRPISCSSRAICEPASLRAAW